jgi:hypothetical protein
MRAEPGTDETDRLPDREVEVAIPNSGIATRQVSDELALPDRELMS